MLLAQTYLDTCFAEVSAHTSADFNGTKTFSSTHFFRVGFLSALPKQPKQIKLLRWRHQSRRKTAGFRVLLWLPMYIKFWSSPGQPDRHASCLEATCQLWASHHAACHHAGRHHVATWAGGHWEWGVVQVASLGNVGHELSFLQGGAFYTMRVVKHRHRCPEGWGALYLWKYSKLSWRSPEQPSWLDVTPTWATQKPDLGHFPPHRVSRFWGWMDLVFLIQSCTDSAQPCTLIGFSTLFLCEQLCSPL